jgi:hypothetical protein
MQYIYYRIKKLCIKLVNKNKTTSVFSSSSSRRDSVATDSEAASWKHITWRLREKKNRLYKVGIRRKSSGTPGLYISMRGRLAFNRNFQLFFWKKEANELDFTDQDFFFDNLYTAMCQHTARTTVKRIIRWHLHTMFRVTCQSCMSVKNH